MVGDEQNAFQHHKLPIMELATPVWVISWQMQAMCSGVMGWRCNMYQWIISIAQRTDMKHFSNAFSR